MYTPNAFAAQDPAARADVRDGEGRTWDTARQQIYPTKVPARDMMNVIMLTLRVSFLT